MNHQNPFLVPGHYSRHAQNNKKVLICIFAMAVKRGRPAGSAAVNINAAHRRHSKQGKPAVNIATVVKTHFQAKLYNEQRQKSNGSAENPLRIYKFFIIIPCFWHGIKKSRQYRVPTQEDNADRYISTGSDSSFAETRSSIRASFAVSVPSLFASPAFV
jgi:hypothetical protein